MDDPVVSIHSLSKVHGRGSGAIKALGVVDVDITRARFITTMGPSGLGKPTLMHCLADLDLITSGGIILDGDMTFSMNQRHLTCLCHERTDSIFWPFNLAPALTTAENITPPLDITRKKTNSQRFDQAVDTAGFRECLSHWPVELSDGQIQRVACARVLVGELAVVFAGESTGNLDSHLTDQVLEILHRSVDDLGWSVIIMTREPRVAVWADTVVFPRDGHVITQLDDLDRNRVLGALRRPSGTESAPTAALQSGSAVKGV